MTINDLNDAYIVCEALKQFKDYLIQERDKPNCPEYDKMSIQKDIMDSERLILEASMTIWKLEEEMKVDMSNGIGKDMDNLVFGGKDGN